MGGVSEAAILSLVDGEAWASSQDFALLTKSAVQLPDETTGEDEVHFHPFSRRGPLVRPSHTRSLAGGGTERGGTAAAIHEIWGET